VCGMELTVTTSGVDFSLPCSTRLDNVSEVFVSDTVQAGITDAQLVLKDARVLLRLTSMPGGVLAVSADPLSNGPLVTNDGVTPILMIGSSLVVIAWVGRLCVACDEVTVAP